MLASERYLPSDGRMPQKVCGAVRNCSRNGLKREVLDEVVLAAVLVGGVGGVLPEPLDVSRAGAWRLAWRGWRMAGGSGWSVGDACLP